MPHTRLNDVRSDTNVFGSAIRVGADVGGDFRLVLGVVVCGPFVLVLGALDDEFVDAVRMGQHRAGEERLSAEGMVEMGVREHDRPRQRRHGAHGRRPLGALRLVAAGVHDEAGVVADDQPE
ncbi:hypothetical protein GCM10018954_084420 [Kutzneria kofuensis]